MNKLTLYIIITLILFIVSCVPVKINTQRTSYYNKNGAYTGYSLETQNHIRFYDKHGHFVGSGNK